MMRRHTFLILLLTLLAVVPVSAQDATGELLARINNLRAGLGLHAYTLHPALNAAARNQAQWMATSGNVSHYRPDGTGPRDRAVAAGYPSNWVSENIYMGPNAGVNGAWRFWTNSPVHYAGLTGEHYQHIGIGSASGNGGRAFVLVFGNPGTSLPSSGQNSGNSAPRSNPGPTEPPTPPPFIVGQDEHGNIMHEIQPGDTLGDIALYYGYTWADIPAMLELNNLTEEDARVLEVGTIFLVPPQSGTYTPTPAPSSTPAPTRPPSATPTATIPPTQPPPTQPPPTIADLRVPETASPTAALRVAAVPTDTNTGQTIRATETVSPAGPPAWLFIAIAVQVVALLLAALELIRRLGR